MAIDLVTGKAGSAHIDGADWGALNAGILGTNDYVLQVWNQFNANLQDNNHIVIDTGCAVMNGRQAVVTSAETVTIESGTQGQKRNDLICLRYSRDSNGIETAKLVCVKGTPTSGTASDPKLNTGSILLGSTTTHDMALYRVSLNGITAAAPVRLFSTLNPMQSVWDSLTQTVTWSKLADGADTVNVTGTVVNNTALLRVYWMNNGGFNSPSWKRVSLARMLNFKTNGEGYDFICAENTGSDTAGSGIIGVQNQEIYWQHTGGAYDIPQQQWHQAALVFPVVRV
ncbi:hypothetical protein EMO89_01705 [Bifidobacterium tissieri]|uniref:Uncharacterized protein n=1 Tax=Bifidobacterium tissieri TaxID=1630162 RepID=A0A5M9ZV17_9BIFI|nr:hypothetical protein [Bifidobacterium tissieri]KAA8831476.1 hypothetical protein EMO89_01705 [Bifidobacterium tissieri]